jgi:hypothetical protein
MKNIHIDFQGPHTSFQGSSILALNMAREHQMKEPAIMSWHRQSNQGMSPSFEGADPKTWWEKFGEGNGGRMQVSVGNEFAFVMMDTRAYETVGKLPLRNLSDSHGNQYLCYSPLLGQDAKNPTMDACIELDGWAADQY